MTARPLLPSISGSTHPDQVKLLMSYAGERLRSACSILVLSFEGSTDVEPDICDGVQFLCKAAIANLNELIALGIPGDWDVVKLHLQAAVSVLEMGFEKLEGLDADAAFGVSAILIQAEKELEKCLENLEESLQ